MVNRGTKGQESKGENVFILPFPQRGYVFRQNPVVKVFPDAPGNSNFGLQLAINTNQFGRTFQDRYVALHTHTQCKPRLRAAPLFGYSSKMEEGTRF